MSIERLISVLTTVRQNAESNASVAGRPMLRHADIVAIAEAVADGGGVDEDEAAAIREFARHVEAPMADRVCLQRWAQPRRYWLNPSSNPAAGLTPPSGRALAPPSSERTRVPVAHTPLIDRAFDRAADARREQVRATYASMPNSTEMNALLDMPIMRGLAESLWTTLVAANGSDDFSRMRMRRFYDALGQQKTNLTQAREFSALSADQQTVLLSYLNDLSDDFQQRFGLSEQSAEAQSEE